MSFKTKKSNFKKWIDHRMGSICEPRTLPYVEEVLIGISSYC